MRRWILALAAVVAVSFAFGACGGDDDKTIKTDDGEITVGGDLPDDFPDSFPVYDGADFQGGAQGNEGGVEGFVATWKTGDSAEDVAEFYNNEFEDGPWKSSSSGNSGGGSFWIAENEDEKLTAYVGVQEIDGDTSITAVVGSSEDFGTDDDDPTEPADDDESTPDDGDSGSGDGDGSGGGELPDEVDLDDDFPADKIYIPSDARVTSSSNFSTGDNATYFVEVYVKSGDAESVADDYKDEMESKGWDNAFTSEADGTFIQTYSNTEGTESASVSAGDSDVDGYVLVTLTVNVTGTE